MASTANEDNPGLVNLERELVCFICTEILFQPLTLLDCLHTFDGSCLQGWFSHQHRQASRNNNTTTNPYTCPTCRAPVKAARPNAMVNTWLDMFLKANPSRQRSEEEKAEHTAMYKPGDNILPKVGSGRRRERRSRRDEEEARERRMIEEARELSLRDMQIAPSSTSTPNATHLQPPLPPRSDHSSRSRDGSRAQDRDRERDREREERRQRRREQERERRARRDEAENATVGEQAQAPERRQSMSPIPSPPATSPRHPDAVEARSRQQTVVHQASLVSLISSSESGTGTGTSETQSTARILQEIMNTGLVDGIDLDSLTEAEQEVWVERIVEAYKQRMREMQRGNASSNQTSPSHVASVSNANSVRPTNSSHQHHHHPQHRRHGRSTSEASSQRRPDTAASPQAEPGSDRARPPRTQVAESGNAQLPPASMTTQRRRRHSNNSQSAVTIRARSRQTSPTSESRPVPETGNASRPTELTFSQRVGRPSNGSRSNTDTTSSPQASETPLPNALPSENSRPAVATESATSAVTTPPVSSPRGSIAELAGGSPRSPRVSARTLSMSNWQAPPRFEEPSISCYRCHRSDIQYEVHKHCNRCDVDLCLRCYRQGRGCKHWFGFGHAAMAKFESLNADRRDSEQVELPHLLVGRSLRRPHESLILESKLAKDGKTIIPRKTMSDPASRTQEGLFCDLCGVYANNCFWSCDFCNDGEWGFCHDCVNSHHCCTHPLLPIAHKSSAPANSGNTNLEMSPRLASSELHIANLATSPRPSQPSSAASVVSSMAGPLPGYVNLDINTRCDICSQSIHPTYLRYHCPFHPSPTQGNPSRQGDYDICTQCYHHLVKTNRVKRDDGPAGWRKCSAGHRMIITTFKSDPDGGCRRVIANDLVGGWKFTEADVNAWMQAMLRRRDVQSGTVTAPGGSASTNEASPTTPVSNPLDPALNPKDTWSWREDSSSTRRQTRTRGISIMSPAQPATATASPITPASSMISATAPPTSTPASPSTANPNNQHLKFPPDGGFGSRGTALWYWYPEEGDDGKGELMFPKGAEVKEIEYINGDWWGGVYAGSFGVWPDGYVRV